MMALLLRRSSCSIQATRGASVSQAARPRNPGLAQVGPDSQAGRIWRRPSVAGGYLAARW